MAGMGDLEASDPVIDQVDDVDEQLVCALDGCEETFTPERPGHIYHHPTCRRRAHERRTGRTRDSYPRNARRVRPRSHSRSRRSGTRQPTRYAICRVTRRGKGGAPEAFRVVDTILENKRERALLQSGRDVERHIAIPARDLGVS